MRENMNLPLNCEALMKANSSIPKISLEESVRRHVFLMLISRFGSNRCFPEYGSELWEHDFENLKTLDNKKPQLEHAIKTMMAQHEKRLGDVRISIQIKEEPFQDPLKTTRKITKKIEVKIKGILLETNKVFDPPTYVIFFSPVALDINNNLK